MTDAQKAALNLMIESVIKPDHRLRGCAYNQECYDELMEWRERMLELLYSYEKNGIPIKIEGLGKKKPRILDFFFTFNRK